MPKTARFSKPSLLSGMAETRRKLLETAAALPPAARTQVFLGTWSVVELLAHLAGWDEANQQAIQAVRRGELPDFYVFAGNA